MSIDASDKPFVSLSIHFSPLAMVMIGNPSLAASCGGDNHRLRDKCPVAGFVPRQLAGRFPGHSQIPYPRLSPVFKAVHRRPVLFAAKASLEPCSVLQAEHVLALLGWRTKSCP
ncbi:hypothetical protein [Roseibium aggregatum]|uniref:hypothetical protein n=1 Tax=Roseibium aggregatum TaxID=187304 RepID=UPI003A97C292